MVKKESRVPQPRLPTTSKAHEDVTKDVFF